jgi:lysophospholipase L1-like esterase
MPFAYAPPDPLRSLAGIHTPVSGLYQHRQNTAPMRNIVFIGDSIIEGHVGNTKGPVTSFREQLAVAEPALVQHGGFQAPWRTIERAPWIGAWTYSGTWTALSSPLPPFSVAATGNRNTPNSFAAGAVATWTRPAALDVSEIDLYYIDAQVFGLGFSYSIDGGASWVDVPPQNPAVATMIKLTIPGLANPATLRIRTLRGDGVTQGSVVGIVGIVVRAGTTGVTIHNIGRGGAAFATPFLSLSGVPARDWQTLLTSIAPDLTVMLMSNDDDPELRETLFAVMGEVATKLVALGGDVVLIGQMDQNGRNQSYENAKNAQLQQLAIANGFGYINLAERWGTWDQAVAAGLMSDNFHPTNKGGDQIAAALNTLLRVS